MGNISQLLIPCVWVVATENPAAATWYEEEAAV